MKLRNLSLVVICVALPVFPGQGQSRSDDPHQKALDVLRRTLAEGSPTATTSPAAPATDPALAAMEQKYLAGKITSKQFQKYLQEHSASSATPLAPASPETQAQALRLLRQVISNAEAGAAASPGPSKPGAPDAGTEVAIDQSRNSPVHPGLSELEAKMDELIRLKAARDKAAQEGTAPAPASGSSAPKTKRERLDELLKLVIDGKITDAEYKEKRSKIIAEKD